MNYCEIKNLDIANGPGLRVSLFVSGCTHHCKGCFNPESWDFNFGQPFTEATEDEILRLWRMSISVACHFWAVNPSSRRIRPCLSTCCAV